MPAFAARVAAVVALLGGASASHQIDPFNIENFMKPEVMPHLIKSTQEQAANLLKGQDIVKGGSPVSWAQCADDKNVFTKDDSTAAIPDPLSKGSDVKLHLVGALSDAINLSNVHIHVDWNGVSLYDEDHKGEQEFDDVLTYDLQWSVPSYAPNGQYVATLTGIDKDGSSKDFCVTASFSFN